MSVAGVQKKIAGELLGDSAAALQAMGVWSRFETKCTGDSNGIQPIMAEEALIFPRRHRINEHFWYVLEFN